MNDILKKAEETKARWFSFTDKLEERLIELCNASVPELKEAYRNDTDIHKRNYFYLLSGLRGQINSIFEKAEQTQDEKVSDILDELSDELDSIDNDEAYSRLENIKDECYDRMREFEEKADKFIALLENTKTVDYEVEYKAILDEYEQIKDKFKCKQCGSPIFIPELFFITTYVECPACNTQNTFEPSSSAANIEAVAINLAEQRTANLLNAYENELKRERDLYFQKHELELALDFGKDPETNSEISRLEKTRKESIVLAQNTYKEYLKAKFDELIALVPKLAEQNKRVYERQLADFEKTIYN